LSGTFLILASIHATIIMYYFGPMERLSSVILNTYIYLPVSSMLSLPYIFYILLYSKTDNVIKKLYSLNIDDINRLKNKSYIPIGMGGLGLCSLFGLATNESFNSMQAGIANMKMICHRFPKYANMANTYLNAGVRNMDNESVLRNPTAFRTKLRCLNLRRFENAAKAKIIMSSTNALIETVNSGKYDNVDEAILRVIESTKDLSEVKRKLLWDLSIKSYIDTLVGKLSSHHRRYHKVPMTNNSSRQLR
jgi:hypothetical protein